MVDRNKTMWTIIFILLTGICWLLYQFYKRIFLPWRHRQALANLNARMDVADSEFANRRLSGYLSNHTSSDVLSSPEPVEASTADNVAGYGLSSSSWDGEPDSLSPSGESDRPPTYYDVTHNQDHYLSDPPTYAEATQST